MATELARRVRERRQQAGFSYGELAMLSGIGKGYLHNIEHGSPNVGIYTLGALARALDIPLDRLVSALEWVTGEAQDGND